MTFDLAHVQAVCFDIDGTLSDTDDQWASQIERRLRHLSFLFPRRDTRAVARWLVMASESPSNALYHWLDALSLDDKVARLYEHMIRRRKPSAKAFWLMPGAAELLESLDGRFPLAVVSARDDLTTRQFLQQFTLEHCFGAVATSQTCEHTKPYPQPVLWAAAQLRIPAENCVMVGDTTVDILAGKAAGAQTVGLLCGFGTERELRRAGADLILKNLIELRQYLS